MRSTRKSKRSVRAKRDTKAKGKKEDLKATAKVSGWKRFWNRYCAM